MVTAEFAEEQYRQSLNGELVSQHRIFIPTQPEEFSLGVDAIINSQNWNFWNLWPQILRGVVITENLWDATTSNPSNVISNIHFRGNLFIQHKRPEFISRSDGSEYNNWNRPYYRYKFDLYQQSTLSQLEANLSTDDALVVYACPACHTFSDLFNFSLSHTLVNNSNFVKTSDLDNHSRYTFIDGGTEGLAFSEPTKINPLSLKDALSKLRVKKKFDDNLKFLTSLAEKISHTVQKMDESFQYDYRLVVDAYKKNEKDENNVLHKIFAFLSISNIKWHILY